MPENDGAGAGAANASTRPRILVVEDDAAMRDLLKEALSDGGYAVESAAGGRPGVERIRQGGIDLVVSDVKMPDLDGLVGEWRSSAGDETRAFMAKALSDAGR